MYAIRSYYEIDPKERRGPGAAVYMVLTWSLNGVLHGLKARLSNTSADEFLRLIALEEQGGAQVRMLDGGMGLCGNDGLGVVGDAEAGCLDHGEIVRPVAHRDDVAAGDAPGGHELVQRGELCLPAKDRAAYFPGQRSAVVDQRVAPMRA